DGTQDLSHAADSAPPEMRGEASAKGLAPPRRNSTRTTGPAGALFFDARPRGKTPLIVAVDLEGISERTEGAEGSPPRCRRICRQGRAPLSRLTSGRVHWPAGVFAAGLSFLGFA